MLENNMTVTGIGEILWDTFPDSRRPGGAPANFAYHISQFGLKSAVVSAVGNDESGRELKNYLKQKGINGIIETVPFPTGTVNITVDAKGIPAYSITENSAWDNIPFTEQLERLAKQTYAVCFGTLAQRNAVSAETINRFLDMMPGKGKSLKIFDINLRNGYYTRRTIWNSLEKCDILKINDEELTVLSNMAGYDTPDTREACRRLLSEFSLDTVILTCGTKGSRVFSGREESCLDTPEVRTEDTVGAGDSFTAAFTAACLKGKSLREAHRIAVRVAAYVCTQKGAMPKIPDEYLI